MNAVSIFLNKSRKINLPLPKRKTVSAEVASFNLNIESLGFCMSMDLMRSMSSLSTEELDSLTKKVLSTLKHMVGAHKKYTPMYPNFPQQVMDMSEAELYINAISHYLGDFISDNFKVPCRILPKYKKEKREALPEEEVQLRVINLGNQFDFEAVFTNLIGSNGSLSETDKEIVCWFVNNANVKDLLPDSIPQKENLTYLFGKLLEKGTPHYLFKCLKTATDVLRVAVVMSGGDVSLAAKSKFRRFKRSERKFLLEALENTYNTVEDMLRWNEMWKRLARELHPSDYASRFPKMAKAFSIVCNNEEFETTNSTVEKAISTNHIANAVKVLVSRPGDFARRLDHLIRVSNKTQLEIVLNGFEESVGKVSTPVLMQVYAHFKSRNEDTLYKSVFPKGNVAKLQVVEAVTYALDKKIINRVCKAIEDALVERFAKLPKLGKVYLDESLKEQFVPFAQRSASKTLRSFARGSKVAMPEDMKTLRFFIWWKDGDQRTDIDLSAAMYSDDWKEKGTLAYYNLKDFGGCHSGDITSAPKGAAEFIDIDIEKVLQADVRYVIMSVYSFTRQPYCDLPECFAGWMARSKAGSGEIFEARTVMDKVDLTSDTTVCIPMVFDLLERKMIWADLGLTNRLSNYGSYGNSAKTSKEGLMLKAIATLKKPTLYDLFSMHIKARGKLVENKEKADKVFSLYEGITPFDTDLIMKEYLTN